MPKTFDLIIRNADPRSSSVRGRTAAVAQRKKMEARNV